MSFVILLSEVKTRQRMRPSCAAKIISELKREHSTRLHTPSFAFNTVEHRLKQLTPPTVRMVETLLKNADTAMYQAKEYGREQTTNSFRPDMGLSRPSSVNRLGGPACDMLFETPGVCCCHYQPMINLQNRRYNEC